MTKLISWNVNGLRACIGKGFLDFLHQVDADIVCLQETKLSEGSCSLSLMATASIGTTQKSEQVRAGKLKTNDGSPLAEMQIGYASWNG